MMLKTCCIFLLCLYTNLIFAWSDFENLNAPIKKNLDSKYIADFNNGMAAIYKRDVNSALSILAPIAEKGVTEAQIALSDLLNKTNLKESIKWSYFAGINDDWKSQVVVANAYLKGVHTSQNFTKSLLWLKKANNNSFEELYEDKKAIQSYIYHDAINDLNKKKLESAEEKLLLIAEFGDVNAQFKLGKLYKDGKYGKLKTQFSTEWLKKAANQGLTDAQFLVSMEGLRDEKLSEKEKLSAINMLKKASKPGNAKAQYKLGLLYLSGKYIKEDVDSGIQYLRFAAEQKVEDAQYALGVHYSIGKIVNKNLNEAHNWFKKAANQGHAKSAYNLALTYLYGLGTKKDRQLASKWLNNSKKNGYKPRSKYPLVITKKLVNTNLSGAHKLTRYESLATNNKKSKTNNGIYYEPVKGYKWVKELVKNNGYTLQLFAASNKETIDDFLIKYQINKDFLYYIRRTDTSKNTHVLLYGEFYDYKIAQKKANNITRQFKSIKPWIRTISSVKSREYEGFKRHL